MSLNNVTTAVSLIHLLYGQYGWYFFRVQQGVDGDINGWFDPVYWYIG